MNFKIVMFWIISLTILLLLTIGANSSIITNSKSGVPVTTHCEYYNETNCVNGSGQGCYEKQECSPHESGKRNHCFVVWHLESDGKRTIKLKGCFLNSFECYNKTECVEKSQSPNKSYLFCCCEGDMCNQNFTWDPSPTEPPKLGITVDTTEYEEQMQAKIVMVYVLISILAVIILIGGVYWFYGPHRLALFMEIPTDGGRPAVPSSPRLGVRPIQLIEVKARGRYGAVWKAQYKTEEVAVKIFPIQDKQSWISEQEIFQLPRMNCHPNILQYIGAEKRGDNLHAEFWLITAYHEKGSLCDFLKSNVLTWSQLCRIAETMSRGLMFLHEEIPASKSDGYKPAVAHRDFKSKNVLLKSDLTACIADFGLALIFQPGQPCGDTHGQVGTRRYMAPEVLEGAINFTRDSFLRIDMYACGLVLWELASRCSVTSATLKEYHLPLEEEVGQLPTLEDMQEAVVQRKVRPTIKSEWRMHPGMSMLCDTMEECWDHDAEARLSASCVMERIAMQSRFSGTLRISDVQQQQQTDTLNVAMLA